jgi:hypothetical protein
LDEGDRFEEDLAAIPDIAAGCLCETVNRIHNQHGQVPSVKTVSPGITNKSALIQDWFFFESDTLRKAFCFVQPNPEGGVQLGTLRSENP